MGYPYPYFCLCSFLGPDIRACVCVGDRLKPCRGNVHGADKAMSAKSD